MRRGFRWVVFGLPGHMARVRWIPNVNVLPFMPAPGAIFLARVDHRMAPLTVRDLRVPLPVNPLASAVTAITLMTSGSRKVERRLPAAVGTPYLRQVRIGHWVPVTVGAGVATGHLLAAASRASREGAPRWMSPAMPHHSSTVTANLCRCLLGRLRAF